MNVFYADFIQKSSEIMHKLMYIYTYIHVNFEKRKACVVQGLKMRVA